LKRRELESHLAAHGCEVLREGSNHTIWRNPPGDLRTPVARHREIPTGTARAICRQLGSPAIRSPLNAQGIVLTLRRRTATGPESPFSGRATLRPSICHVRGSRQPTAALRCVASAKAANERGDRLRVRAAATLQELPVVTRRDRAVAGRIRFTRFCERQGVDGVLEVSRVGFV
jgi:hypothetical protein